MARNASMTPAECEAMLGTRGSLQVNVDNRHLVRKWLVARGLASSFVGTLPMTNLQQAYNDTTDDFLRNLTDGAAQTHKTAAQQQTAAPITQAQSAAETTHATPADVNRVAAMLAELLAKPTPAGIDANAVNALIDARWNDLPELIAKHSPITRIEIGRQDGTKHEIEGHAHPMLATLIKAMDARMANGKHPNIFIVGPTGSGKTHGVEQAAAALGLEFYTNGAISMDHQLIGFKDAAGNYHETPLRKAFARKAVYLFDEIDSSDNSPLLCLAGALANSGFAFPDAFVARHPDSVIIAAGNTWGLGATADFVGRNKLDGAIRSRFPVRIQWDYDESLERKICGNVDWACRVQKARANARKTGLKVIIDPRMSQAGAALIAAGMSPDEAANLTYLADLSADQRRIVEAA